MSSFLKHNVEGDNVEEIAKASRCLESVKDNLGFHALFQELGFKMVNKGVLSLIDS